MPKKIVRKAVIPAAGMGTRLLPITKNQPKEMMPILNKPLIQYAVEEAVAAGIETIILVLAEGKTSLQTYFQPDTKLESWLQTHGKLDELEQLRRLSRLANVCSVIQPQPQGLGQAIACAREMVGDEPFAILLPDALIRSDTPCIAQLLEVYACGGDGVIGMQKIEPRESRRYGIIAGRKVVSAPGGRLVLRVDWLAEKPAPEEAPSSYGIVGRYVVGPEIFACIEQIHPADNEEIQLTAALNTYAQRFELLAALVEGSEYDAGDRMGFIRANLEYALRDPEIGAKVRAYLDQLRSVAKTQGR